MFLSKGLGFGFQGFCATCAAQVCKQSTFTAQEELGGLKSNKLSPKMRNHHLMDSVLLTDPKAKRQKEKEDKRMFSRQSVERDLKE